MRRHETGGGSLDAMGAAATMRALLPPALRARDTPTSMPAVPTAPQNTSSDPSCARISTPISR
jgi:hypothetical protein